MKDLPLHIKIVIGLVLGVIWAFVSSLLGWNTFTINWIDPFGAIFIRLLKFIAVPLVLFSIISGISGLTDVSKLGRMGGKTLGLYFITTIIAVLIGLLFVNLAKPGSMMEDEQRIKNRLVYETWANENGVEILDGKNFLSDTKYSKQRDQISLSTLPEKDKKSVKQKMKDAGITKDATPLQFIVDMVPENIILSISDNKLMLQVIFFAIFFGITLAVLPSATVAPVTNFINALNQVFLKMVDFVMKVSPFFVFALLAGVIAKMADTPAEVLEIFLGLGSYSITLLLGLFFMVFVFCFGLASFFLSAGFWLCLLF